MSDVTGVQSRKMYTPYYGPRPRGIPHGATLVAMPGGIHTQLPYPVLRNRSAPTVAVRQRPQPSYNDPNRHTPTPATSNSSQSTPKHVFTPLHGTSPEVDSSKEPMTPMADQTFNSAIVISPTVAGVIVGLEEHTDNGTELLPSYYDYSEPFIGVQKSEIKVSSNSVIDAPSLVPQGFVHRVKTLLETQSASQELPSSSASVQSSAELPACDVVEEQPSVAELPGDTIQRRITREIIVEALQSTSDAEATATTFISAALESPLSASKNLAVDQSLESISISDGLATASSLSSRTIIDIDAPSEETDTTLDSIPDPLPASESENRHEATNSQSLVVDTTSTRDRHSLAVGSPSSDTTPSSEGFEREEETEKSIDTLPALFEHIKTVSTQRVESIKTSPSRVEESKVQTATASSENLGEDANASSAFAQHSRSLPHLQSAPTKSVIQSVDLDLPSTLSAPTLQKEDLSAPTSIASDPPRPLFSSDKSSPGYASILMTDIITPPKPLPSRESNTTTHLTWNYRKSIAAPSSFNLDRGPNRRLSQDSTTDLRLSCLRYPGAYLPDVKEESHEGSSLADSRPTSFNVAPAAPVTKTSCDNLTLKLFGREDSVRSFQRSPSQQLLQSRMIPSLNFSSMDLFAKLNGVLDLRYSRSLGDVTGTLRFENLEVPKVERRVSSGSIRERYKSFLADLEESGEAIDTIMPQRHSVDVLAPANALSNVLIEEITKLSIPSVTGLTQRLSELLPSFKRYIDNNEVIVEDDCEVLTHLAGEQDSTHQRIIHPERSSRRLRALPGHPGLVVIDDDVYERFIGDVNHSHSKESESSGQLPVTELEVPAQAHLRVQTPHLSGQVIEGGKAKATPDKKSSPAHSSPGDGCPWNHDKCYPWTSSAPEIDIFLPAPAHLREAVGPTRLRHGLSHSLGSADIRLHRKDCSSPIYLDRCRSQVGRKSSKSSAHGSLSFQSGLKGGIIDANGFARTPEVLGIDDRTVDPGDRYPTTGLSPPTACNMEEIRSFFSDDSSQGDDDHHTFRKRITNFRTNIPPVRRVMSALDRRSADQGGPVIRGARRGDGITSCQSRADSVDDCIARTFSLDTFDGAVGMNKFEFRARKMAERLRMLWHRGGELFRSLSFRTKKNSISGRLSGAGYGSSDSDGLRDSGATTVYEGT